MDVRTGRAHLLPQPVVVPVVSSRDEGKGPDGGERHLRGVAGQRLREGRVRDCLLEGGVRGAGVDVGETEGSREVGDAMQTLKKSDKFAITSKKS